jgi:hypothetical protein
MERKRKGPEIIGESYLGGRRDWKEKNVEEYGRDE